MVKSVDFAVRDGAGGVSHGMVSGEGASNFIQVGAGDEISLNLRKTSILKYLREGSDLEIVLVDGRSIKLAGFYDAQAKLYISSDGELTPVTLEGGADGVIYADYGQIEVIGKWSPNDQLAFLGGEEIAVPAGAGDTTGMAMFAPAMLGGLGGAGLAAGAAVVGVGLISGDDTTPGGDDTTPGGDDTTPGGDDTTPGGDDTTPGGDDTTPGGDDTTPGGDDTTPGGDDTTPGGDDTTPGGDDTTPGGDDTTPGGDDTTPGGDDPIVPTVNNPNADTTLTTNTPSPAAGVSGTGEVGSVVTVVLGDQTLDTTVGADGTWSVTFEGSSFPADGDLTSTVFVTAPDGTLYELDGPDFLIDMTPPAVSVTEGALSNGDVENLAEYQDGITVGGTGEVGAAIMVTVAGHEQSTTVGADGTWSVTFTTTQLPPGDYREAMTITATDALGNVTTLTDTLVVDTVPNPIEFNPVATNNVINAIEMQGNVVVSGTSVPGAVLAITMEGVTHQTTVATDGTWSVTYLATELPGGTYDSTITAATIDPVNNPSSASWSVHVDTEASVAFGTAPVTANNNVNGAEAHDGFTLSGSSEPGSVSVTVELGGVSYTTTPAADGSWSVNLSGVALTTGDHLATVTATDAHGNTATDTRSISFDTSTSVAFDAGQAGGNDLLNRTEHSAGLVLTGTAEPGASVVVAFEGATRTVTAGADGQWSASFAAGEMRTGTYTSTATVTATDLAGNVASASHVVAVDTEVQNLSHGTPTPNTIVNDGIVNALEGASGLVVTGTVEPGSVVMVQLASGAEVQATVLENGSWTATIPASQLPTQEIDGVQLTVRATDVNGNTAIQTSSVDFDPVVRNFVPTAAVSGDGFVSAQEAANGFAITGTVEAGSRVTVTLASGATETVTAGAKGQWSVTFDTNDLPGSAGTMSYTIAATDPVGNTTQASGSFAFDLVAPDSPDIIAFTRDAGALLGIRTDVGENVYEVAAVGANGQVTEIDNYASVNSRAGYGAYDFYETVPNGSYLVVSDHDTAGNETSTLLVVDNTSAVTVDLTRSGLSSFDFGTIDLTFAPEAQLTITEAQLNALTGPDHALIIQGDGADHVTALGAVDTGENTVIGGHSYSVYTLGDDGASLIIDDSITNLTV